nr:hypothetical protein [Leptospira ilyithenensis]
MAQFLLTKLAFASFLAIVFVPSFSLFAFDSSSPIMIPADELLTPVQLVDGVVSFVTVSDAEESLSLSSSSLPCEELQTLYEEIVLTDRSLIKKNSDPDLAIISANRLSPGKMLMEGKGLHLLRTFEDPTDYNRIKNANPLIVFSGLSLQNEGVPEQFSLNSIANLSPVAFLGICLNQSELPSKNLPMQCGSFLSKSMIQKFVKDSISLWQRAKTTSLWPRSINCLPIRNPLIQEQYLSHTHSTSDISFIWLREMAGSPVSPGSVLETGKKKVTLASKPIA